MQQRSAPSHKRAFGLSPVGEEAAGLPAQLAVVPASLFRSALSYERALSEADVQRYVATAWTRLRPAA